MGACGSKSKQEEEMVGSKEPEKVEKVEEVEEKEKPSAGLDDLPPELRKGKDDEITEDDRIRVREIFSGKDQNSKMIEREIVDLPVEFSSQFGSGEDSIDQDHFKLYQLLATLKKLKELDSPFTQDIVLALIDYTQYHFSNEEAYMQEHNWELLEDHKAIHQSFVEKVNQKVIEFSYMEIQEISDEFISFLANWLIDHIQTCDCEMVRAIHKRENKKKK